MQEEVLIDARVLKMGKTLATMVCDLRLRGTDRLVAQGRHTKHLPGTEFVLPKGGGGRSLQLMSRTASSL